MSIWSMGGTIGLFCLSVAVERIVGSITSNNGLRSAGDALLRELAQMMRETSSVRAISVVVMPG
jgi:hypothetical protein